MGIALLLSCSNTDPFRTSDQNSPDSVFPSRELVDLTSPDGEKRLFESRSRADFLPLVIHFETQQNLAYCGVASMSMVLNAMQIPAPINRQFKRYPMFTQDNLFNKATDSILDVDTITRRGMTLEQLGQLLAVHGLPITTLHAGDIDVDRFRSLAVENLKQPNNFVLVNYLRKAIGQESGGHISPLAAYHSTSDSFLILDVSRYKYPPVWVSAEELWGAMNTIDSASGKTRGMVLVGETE